MHKIVITFIGLFISLSLHADIIHKTNYEGDHFAYIPDKTPENILVIAHGILSRTDNAENVAKTYLSNWIQYAEEHNLLLIAPVFDTPRFGNREGAYGGYRNLFGKYIHADEFVNKLVSQYSSQTSSKSTMFYMYGHGAGGQFVNRYVVTHPNKIIHAVISSTARYSYPTKTIEWPYGAGDLSKTLEWSDETRNVYVTKDLRNYALAASKISIVTSSKDTKNQSKRPAHKGSNRIEFAQSWANDMNKNARLHGLKGNVKVSLIDRVGYNSYELISFSAKVLLNVSNDDANEISETSEKLPALWSSIKDLKKSKQECEAQSSRVLKSISLENQIENTSGIYGVLNTNRVVVKCLEVSKSTSKLMVAVAGYDKNSVEKIRNNIVTLILSSSKKKHPKDLKDISSTKLTKTEKTQRKLVSRFYEVLEIMPNTCAESSKEEYIKSVENFEETYPEFIALIKESRFRSYAIEHFSKNTSTVSKESCLFIKKTLDAEVNTKKGKIDMLKNTVIMRQ